MAAFLNVGPEKTSRNASGFIKDCRVQQIEPFQRMLGRDFLCTGRPPAVGLRTEAQLDLPNGAWCILSGVISHVGKEPNYYDWNGGSSMLAPHCAAPTPDTIVQMVPRPGPCPEPDCAMCYLRKNGNVASGSDLMKLSKEYFGALHGQKITAFGYLNPDWWRVQERSPFKSDGIYKMGFKCDDSKQCVWILDSLEDVTDWPVSKFPKDFKDWTIGHQMCSRSAPLYLSDLERKIWPLHKEVKWEKQRKAEDPAEPKSALFLFSLEKHPDTMKMPMMMDGVTAEPLNSSKDDFKKISSEFKNALVKAHLAFEALPKEDRKAWSDKAAEDKKRFEREKREHGFDDY